MKKHTIATALTSTENFKVEKRIKFLEDSLGGFSITKSAYIKKLIGDDLKKSA